MEDLHDRESEKESLISLLDKEPSAIHVMLGPRNCGKSKLLNSVVKERNAVIIDCRGNDTTSPSIFISTLAQILVDRIPKDDVQDTIARLGSAIGSALKLTQKINGTPEPSADLLGVLKALINGNEVTPKSMDNVFSAFRFLLLDLNKSGYYPVFAIDEVRYRYHSPY